MKINIAEEFSVSTGGRYIEESDYSGELFRENMLEPRYQAALEKGEKLEIDFDNLYGYSPSFLEEAFGGLVRVRKEHGIFDNLILISNDSASLVEDVKKYITQAEDKLKR